MKTVILYSGGLDSYIMGLVAEYYDRPAIKAYYDIGQDYAPKEIASLPDDVQVFDFSAWAASTAEKDSESGSIFIPGRNATLINMAASMFVPDRIWLGALVGEIHARATDKNFEFLKLINKMLKYVYRPYDNTPIASFPLADMRLNKLTATEWALNHGATPESVMATSSCLDGSTDLPCGECVVCARRWGIFDQLGFEEIYESHPLLSPKNKKMFDDMLTGDESYYDADRRSELVPTLKKYGYKA